jgi:hypothetical protein
MSKKWYLDHEYAHFIPLKINLWTQGCKGKLWRKWVYFFSIRTRLNNALKLRHNVAMHWVLPLDASSIIPTHPSRFGCVKCFLSPFFMVIMEWPSPLHVLIMELPSPLLKVMNVGRGGACGIMMWKQGVHFSSPNWIVNTINCQTSKCKHVFYLFLALFTYQWFVCFLSLVWNVFITFCRLSMHIALLLWIVNYVIWIRWSWKFGIWSLV